MEQQLEGINLYSDTQTLPTREMRDAMRDAVLGDDVSQTDPTVKRLEALAAERVGKEAALFVPSGHMGNLIGIMLHCKPGDEAIMEANAHVYYYEGGAAASVAGVMPRLVEGRRGVFTAEQVRALLRPENIHFPWTRLICVENTHNRGGGAVLPLENMSAIADLARAEGIAIHLDGARLFNAATALKVEASEIARHADTVMFCLSKGLSAPVGSMLAGPKDLIVEARRIRKRLGGGMRQAGVLAAAGIIALTRMVDRLVEDHENARALAEGLAAIDGCGIDLESVQTNMVMLDVSGLGLTTSQFLERLARSEITASPMPPYGVRFVTHRHIDRGHIQTVIDAVAAVAGDR